MFPPMELEGADYYLKAMNCPMHNLIFRSRGRSYRELPLRLFEFGSRLPLREVRRRARADPGARHDPGRLALLRHPGAGARRDQAPARLLPRAVPRLRARRLLPRAVDPRRLQAGQVRRLRRGVGGRDRGAARRSPTESGLELVPDPGGAAYYGPKISVQARDAIGRTWQMSTIQYDFNQPRRLRARVPGRRRHPAAAGDDPLGEVRLDRAVHRRARRALRRRVPALAGAGAGAGRSRSPSGTTTTCTTSRSGCEARGHPGRGRRLRRPDAEEDPQRAAAEGAVHGDRRRPGHRGGRGVVPLPRRRTRTTASRSTRPSRASPRPSRRASRSDLAWSCDPAGRVRWWTVPTGCCSPAHRPVHG